LVSSDTIFIVSLTPQPAPEPSKPPKRRSGGDLTAFGCLLILAAIAYWAGLFPPSTYRRSYRDPHEALPWLLVAAVVFGIRALLAALKRK
jgi:hypothetical protein